MAQSFTLTDDAVIEMTSVLGGMTSSIGEKLNKLRKVMDDFAQENRYQPALQLMNSFVEAFQGEGTRKSVTNRLDEWKSGKGSCLAMMKPMAAGSKAEEFAEETDNKLLAIVENFWGSKPLGDLISGVDTSQPDVDVDKLHNYYTAFTNTKNEVIDECNKTRNQVNEAAASNIVLVPLAAIVNTLCACIDAALEAMTGNIKTIESAFSERKHTAQETAKAIAEECAAAVNPGVISELAGVTGLL